MEENKMPLDPKITGFVYNDHTYMVAGYISDYKLTYKPKEGEKSVNDFVENKGYVDEHGNIYIFRKKRTKELIPWFTVVMNVNGEPSLQFNTYRREELKEAFHISRIRSLSLDHIERETKPDEELYDKEVINDLMNATSTFVPEVKDSDDFLKKIIKQTIINKGVNVHKYKKLMKHSYELSNLLQGLNGTTKTSPIVFQTWMELLGCDFVIAVKDNGTDSDPLMEPIRYQSNLNEIKTIGKDDDNEKVLRSAH